MTAELEAYGDRAVRAHARRAQALRHELADLVAELERRAGPWLDVLRFVVRHRVALATGAAAAAAALWMGLRWRRVARVRGRSAIQRLVC